MGIDLLREHLGTLAVQSRRQRLTRNVTPHPCIVAHGRSACKDLSKLTEDGGQETGPGPPRPRGYEFMDLEQNPDPRFDTEDPHDARPSGQSAGPLGLAGAAAKSGVTQPARLRTLTGDG